MSDSPLLTDALPRGAHRVIWWMLKNQKREDGVPTGEIEIGWRERVRNDLKISDVALWKIEKQLKAQGVIEGHPWARAVRLRAEIFN